MESLAIIGGTGLYVPDMLEDLEEVSVDTPFGRPSAPVLTGIHKGLKVGFIPRHGKGHRLLPSEIPFRANIWALKSLGFDWVISVSLVGSMKEEVGLGTPVIIDQFIDRTFKRENTFFGNGIVGHVSMADPVCPALRKALIDAADAAGVEVISRGTYLCIEGPQFSTRAESLFYRQMGVDVIGMTNMPEAKLAREAGIHYATIAIPTDYDCWHESEEDVTVEKVMEVASKGLAKAKRIILQVLEHPEIVEECDCSKWTQGAVITDPSIIPAEARKRLEGIITLPGEK